MKYKTLPKKIAAWLFFGCMALEPVVGEAAQSEAPIVPDTNAQAQHQPLVQQTANGIPLVNITAPTAGGVSRNEYRNFNVPKTGAVLNNSHTLTNTQLAGYVQGNPNMARGTAKIIVNEVTSSRLTNMNGFLEVAGDRASVVIANPNGITVNGGGFINTSQAMLTTGRPQYDAQGNVHSLQVTGGTITISGNGLDATKTDKLSILSRAVEVNAGIWANEAHAITGANDVDYHTLQATAIKGTGTKPKVALDVAAIGGMYANRIFLIGTEKGLGVNTEGTVSATKALSIDGNGNLYVAKTGSIYSDGIADIHTTGNVTNHQTIASGGNLSVHAEQGLTNTAVIGAGVSRAGNVDLAGNLMIQAPTITNDKAQLVSGGDMQISAHTVTSKAGEISSQGNSNLHITGNLVMDNGKITALQNLYIQADSLPLTGLLASGGNLSVTTNADVTNANSAAQMGDVKADGNITLTTDGTLMNVKNIESGKTLTIHAKQGIINEPTGSINGNDVSLQTADINNTGLITSNNTTSITTGQLKNHENGRIYGGDITIHATDVENRRNTALETKLAEAMKVLTEKEQALEAAYRVDVTAFQNASQEQQYKDHIASAGKAYDEQLAIVKAIQAEMDTHKTATIAARNNLAIDAKNTILNSSNAKLYSGNDMHLTAGNTLTNTGASIESIGNMSLQATHMYNENDAFSVKRIGSAWTTNPERIRIDDGPEKGQTFDAREFTDLSSGYGAHHSTHAMPLYEPAYDIVEAPPAGQKEDPAHPTGTKIANYEWNDPVFQTMGLTPMASARPTEAGASQTTWDTQFNALLEQLNTKITAYNAKAEQYNSTLGEAANHPIMLYTIIRTHSQTSQNEVQTSNIGLIRSGKDMTLKGNVENNNSQLVSGGTLSQTDGSLQNIETKDQKLTVTFGTTQGSYTYKRGWPHKARRRGYNSEVFMTPQVVEDNPSSLHIAGYGDHSAQKPTNQDPTTTARDNANKFLDPFNIDTSGATVTPQQWSQTAKDLTSSLYNLHPETTAKYLIETDPAFTNKHQFLSSDYMYEQLKWDPEKVPKRLGDGFYEQGLIRDQILNQTGQRYLGSYTDDDAEYKALMDAGIAYAKKMDIAPGVTLSKEQIAALTSDMVWLETKTIMIDGKPQQVIYPHVYLRANSDMTLTGDGSLISANKLIVDTKDIVYNEGVLQGKTVAIHAGDIQNMGQLSGNTVALSSDTDIHQGGRITATDAVQLQAKGNVTMDNTVTHLANQDVLNQTAGIAVKGDNGVILVEAGKDIHLAGATMQALGEKGAVVLHAGHNVNMTTQQLNAKKDMTQNSDNYLRTQRTTEVGTTIDANSGVSISAKNDINARNAYINSDNGTVSLQAGNNINLTTGRQKAVDDYGIKYKESGLLSSTTTTIHTHDDHETVLGATITGKEVDLKANKDVNATAATIVGQNDVNITAGRNINTTSDTQYDNSSTYIHVKSSGIMGAGMGIFIGTKKTTDTVDGEYKTQVGTTIASSNGKVHISAGDTAHLTTTDVMGKSGINVTAQDITLDGKQNESHLKQTHEESQSGLTVSSSSPVVTLADTARGVMQTVKTRDNKTLQSLELVEGGKDLSKQIKSIGNDPVVGGVHVGLGSSSMKEEHTEDTKTYAGGSLASSGDVTVTAKSQDAEKGNIHATGETITGQNVTLSALKNITVDAGKNTQTIKDNLSNSGASIGATFGGGLQNIDASFSKANDNGTTTVMTHTGTTIMANDTLTTTSGNDTNIIGSQVAGNTVKINAGDNLHVESLQDRETYRGKNASVGGGISYGVANGKLGKSSSSASAGKGSMNSDYTSVTKQAGIYAGNGGYTVNVNNNTHLKGAVIDSTATAEKNSLTTGTLQTEDIQNKAAYDVKSVGISYTHSGNIKEEIDNYNKEGLTPNLSPGAKNDASSTTKAAISQGTITTTKEQIDITQINRDTQHALNELGKIFDKKKIEERQELAKLFEKNASELLHNFDKDGSFDKALAHGIVAEISSQLAGNKAGSGFAAGAINEALINKIDKWAGGAPAKMQWISAALGATVNAATGSNNTTGAMVAQYGTKWNNLSKSEQEKIRLVIENKILKGKLSLPEVIQFLDKWVNKSYQDSKKEKEQQNKKLHLSRHYSKTPNHKSSNNVTTKDVIVSAEIPIVDEKLFEKIAQMEDVDYQYSDKDSMHMTTSNLELLAQKMKEKLVFSQPVWGARIDWSSFGGIDGLGVDASFIGAHWQWYKDESSSNSVEGMVITTSEGINRGNLGYGLSGNFRFDSAKLEHQMGDAINGGNIGISVGNVDVSGQADIQNGISGKYSVYLISLYGNGHQQYHGLHFDEKGEVGFGYASGSKFKGLKNGFTVGVYIPGPGISGGGELTVRTDHTRKKKFNQRKRQL